MSYHQYILWNQTLNVAIPVPSQICYMQSSQKVIIRPHALKTFLYYLFSYDKIHFRTFCYLFKGIWYHRGLNKKQPGILEVFSAKGLELEMTWKRRKIKLTGFGDEKIPWLWKNWRSKIETISESSYIEMPAPEMNKFRVEMDSDVRDQFLALAQWYHGACVVNYTNAKLPP